MPKPKPQFNYGRPWRRLKAKAFALYGPTCWMCGGKATHLDHIDPVQWHGTKMPTIDRVRPACAKCNIGRGNRTRHWRGGQPPVQSQAW